jgi:transposase
MNKYYIAGRAFEKIFLYLKHFLSWAKKEIWNKVLSFFSQGCDIESVMIDGSIVRAHACASGYKKNSQSQQALGRSRGGFTTKIHALVDALGLPIKFLLTPNPVKLSKHLNLSKVLKDLILADKAFDSDVFVNQIVDQGCVPVIPSRSNRKKPRKVDYYLYKERHLIECFFGKLKHFRRIFSRFDKMIKAYMSFLA